MNRREEARVRVREVREACRRGKAPPIDPAARALLEAAVGDDDLRVYQLAEEVVVEGYMRGVTDLQAAGEVVRYWLAFREWAFTVTGRRPLTLRESGWPPGGSRCVAHALHFAWGKPLRRGGPDRLNPGWDPRLSGLHSLRFGLLPDAPPAATKCRCGAWVNPMSLECEACGRRFLIECSCGSTAGGSP